MENQPETYLDRTLKIISSLSGEEQMMTDPVMLQRIPTDVELRTELIETITSRYFGRGGCEQLARYGYMTVVPVEEISTEGLDPTLLHEKEFAWNLEKLELQTTERLMRLKMAGDRKWLLMSDFAN